MESFSAGILSEPFQAFLRASRIYGEVTVMLQNGEVCRAEIKQSVVLRDTKGDVVEYEVQVFRSKR